MTRAANPSRSATAIAFVALGFTVAVTEGACGSSTTSIDVEVKYDTKLALDQLVFHIANLAPVAAPSTPALLTTGDDSAGFVLPDALGDSDVDVAIDGVQKGAVIAHGAATVHAKRGAVTNVVVTVVHVAGCGDGAVVAPEECDDGNASDGDGCSSTCAVELGWTCATNANGKSVCQRCGDGIVQGSEQCDDANLADGDGCSSCKIDPGFTCSSENGAPSTCAPACGDGVVIAPEACDDGNTSDGDGCSHACAVEDGFQCSTSIAGRSTCNAQCGDGIAVAGEECDDGNTSDGDGCSHACTAEDGFTCTIANEVSTCTPDCGDGAVVFGEACDDGNTQSGDGCSSTCAQESGFLCSGAPSSCVTVCGDGFVRAGEQCDDGNTSDGDGCSHTCTREDGFVCAGDPSVCTPTCGDGLIVGRETCDDGNTSDGDGCSSDCDEEIGFVCNGAPSACATVCGDGFVRGAEVCDDGNLVDGDGCSSACTEETGFVCNGEPSVCTPICGDGLVRGDEQCDDGSDPLTGNSDTRPNACRTSCQRPACGDGVRDDAFGEQCDDGNTDDHDACLTGCRTPTCGDGFVQGGEQCDDGNTNASGAPDGCAAACTVDAGFVCFGEPSVCVPAARAHFVTPGNNAIANALNAAVDGDALFLAAGAYDEHVVVNVNVAIVGAATAGGPGVIIDDDANPVRDTISVAAGQVVTLQGLTIENHRAKADVHVDGTATLVGCTLGPGTGVGLQTTAGSSVDVERTRVTTNVGGGVDVAGAYTIVNSVIDGNGDASSGAFSVDLAGAGTFAFDTIVANRGDALHAAVQCAAPTAVATSIVLGNAPAGAGTQVSALCDASTSMTTGSAGFDVDGFHLARGSPAIDGAACAATTFGAVDFDGDARPIGARCDLGADERP